MPLGKVCGSAIILPLLSLLTCQQSSRLIYSYPAACISLETIASVISLTICSEILQPNLFQGFQPIEGVNAKPLFRAEACFARRSILIENVTKRAEYRKKFIFLTIFTLFYLNCF